MQTCSVDLESVSSAPASPSEGKLQLQCMDVPELVPGFYIKGDCSYTRHTGDNGGKGSPRYT